MAKRDLSKLTEDLKAAREAGHKAAAATDDGGTCNFDSPMLYGIRLTKKAEEAIQAAGCHVFKGRGGLVISLGVGGQANKRTRAAEAAEALLKERGYETSIWYQMD